MTWPLDVSIGILSTLCARSMIPLLMQLLASQYVSVPTQSLFLNAVKVVLFPIALGVICHMIFGRKIEGYGRPAYRFSGGYSAYHRRGRLPPTVRSCSWPAPWWPSRWSSCTSLCGYSLGFGYSQADVQRSTRRASATHSREAITFEVGMRDSALGATLALTSFATNPLAAVPSTFFSVA